MDLLRARARAAVGVEAEVRALVAGELGKAFAPERVLFVAGAAEDALREDRAPRGARDRARADPGDMSSVENPESLEAIAAAVG